ncbi:chemotaxis protein CheW, partial [Rickettsiales bacterium]|nr:chemotaxis protein CheW [Rickettsiales bacterium]
KSNYRIEFINSKPVLRIRDQLISLVSLAERLGLKQFTQEECNNKFVAVCEVGGHNFGVIVDNVYDTEEIVVKPVSKILKDLDVYSGCTILGNGNVILILDPNSLVKTTSDHVSNKQSLQNVVDDKDNDEMASFVLFKAGDETPKVIPLELISRLEEIDVKEIEYSNGSAVIQYRNDLMRLCKIDPNYEIPENGIQELLVFTDNSKMMGLMVGEIQDIVKAKMISKLKSSNDGFIGSIVINNRTCDVIDASYYFNKTFNDIEEESASSKARSNSTANNRVLLVDDSPFFRKFIPPELEAGGFRVVTAKDAIDALNILKEDKNFLIIVTDMNMPKMSGQEFVDACKDDESLKHIPFVALSSHCSDDGIFNEGDFHGFEKFVSKTNHADLTQAIKDLVENKEVA